MAYRTILKFPNQFLRTQSEPVTVFGDELQSLVADLHDTLNVESGVGLSAPQIGVAQQVIYVRGGGFDDAMVNPKILESDGLAMLSEGCLSFPGVFESVKRFTTVKCEYQDVTGEKHEAMLSDLAAHIVQHEIEHLDGTLLIDKLSTIKRDRIRRKAKKRARELKGLLNPQDSSRRKKNSHLSKKELKIRKKQRFRPKR